MKRTAEQDAAVCNLVNGCTALIDSWGEDAPGCLSAARRELIQILCIDAKAEGHFGHVHPDTKMLDWLIDTARWYPTAESVSAPVFLSFSRKECFITHESLGPDRYHKQFRKIIKTAMGE